MFRLFTRRAALKRWILIGAFGIMSLGMVITLAPIPGVNTSGTNSSTLADIGDYSISAQDMQRIISEQMRRSPYGFNSKLAAQIARPLLDDMILVYAERIEAAKLGLVVSRAEVDTALESNPMLYPGGKYIGDEQAKAILQQEAGLSPDQYLDQLRQQLLLQKLQRIVTDGVLVSPAEVHAEFLRRNERARIAYVAFDPSQYVKGVAVTPQALEDFFKKNPERYNLPDERRVRYVVIDQDRVRSQVELSDEDLRHYYNQHLSDYRVEDRVKVAHILFKTTGKSAAETAKLEQTARDVLTLVRAGKDFGELAKQSSEDSSAQQGGDIGWIVHGQTVKEFESTAFSLKPGQVSGLVKTEYGIHILKVLDKQVAHLESFDEVKASIRTELERQKLEEAQQSLANDLYAQMKAAPAQSEALARKAGLEMRETGLIRYNEVVPDFGKSEAFSNLAFQLNPGEVGAPITVPKGLAIIQLAQDVPEHTPKLEEVRGRVEEDYRAEEAKVVALEKAREFAGKAKGGNFKAAAKAFGMTVKESKDFSSRDYLEDLGPGSQFEAAFKLSPGEVAEVVPAGGKQVVYQLVARTEANEADFAAQRDAIREQVLAQKRALAFEIYRQNLKQQMIASGELKIKEAAIQQFLTTYQQTP